MEKQNITILKTWKDEVFEINMKFSDYLIMKTNLLAGGVDGFYSESYNEYLKFSRFESEKGKTKYIALPEPKVKVEMTEKERAEFEDYRKNILKKTFEGRKKKFLDRRALILKKLAEEEKYFGLETTQDKISEFNKLKVNMQKGYK